MESGLKFADTANRLKDLATTSLGKKAFGYIAQPVFRDLKKMEHAKLEQDDDDDELKDPSSLITQIQDSFLNNFAFGDMLTGIGIGFLAVQSRLFPSKSKVPGFFEKTFRTLSLGLTFGGSLSAMFGRMSGSHRAVALGDGYADAQLKDAERQGRKIFTEYSEADIHNLIEEAEKLDQLLVYPKGLKEMILERYAKNDIGGLFDGPPGTGKTQGVQCILGKWAKRIQSEGKKVVIAELNLANFDEYLKDINQASADAIKAFNTVAGIASGGEELSSHSQGLQVLELLVKKIQKLVKDTRKHNAHSEQKEELAIFVDEFDKIFDPRTLKGCDKGRLKNLILQFNELFVKNNILLTSNKSLEDIVKEIKKHIESPDSKTAGEEVWKPMYSRFSAKNRARVEKPGPVEQAEIISARLLDHYRAYINWDDFGMPQNGNNNNEIDRKQLSESITIMIEELGLKLDGRELAYACDDIKAMLLGRAREKRLATKTAIPDSTWSQLDSNEKILETGSQIDQELLKETLKVKAASNKLETYDNDRDKVQALLQNYFNLKPIKEQFKASLKDNEVNKVNLLNLLGETFDLRKTEEESKVYQAKQAVQIDGSKHALLIIRKEADIHSNGSEPIFNFVTIGPKQKPTKTRDFNLTELISIMNEVKSSLADQKNKSLNGIVNLVKSAISNPNNPERFINDLEKFTKALST